MEQTSAARGKAAELYTKLEADRRPFLDRAEESSKLTLPGLIPPTGHASGTKLYKPYQSVGSRGVNNLAAKLLMSLFPPNTPFFRLAIDDFTLAELTKQEGMRAQVEEALNKIERSVQTEVETQAIRVFVFEGIKHTLVGGNVLLYMPQEGGTRVFPLSRYVVQRDPMGNVLDIVTKETLAPAMLTEEVKALLATEEGADQKRDKNLDVYTHVARKGDKWEVYQEVAGQVIPSTQGTYPLDKSPWIPIRINHIDGESYGRGFVEEYIGDLTSLEGLSQAILEGSAAAARILILVNPNGTTDKDDVSNAENGAVIHGTMNDLSVLQLEKYADFRVAQEQARDITERLSFAFMLNSAVQRNGERVTAEEIRFMASELESALGGIYSILSQELQLPLVRRLMHSMEKRGKLPSLPKGTVNPVVVTGVEALGRGNDLNKLEQFIQPLLQVPELLGRINMGDYLKRRGTALGIDMAGLIKSEEQLAQEQQQAMMAQMAQQGLGPAINAIGGVAKQQIANQGGANGESPQATAG